MEDEIPEHLGRKPASPRRHPSENNDARIRLLLKRDHRLSHIVRYFSQVPCSITISGLISRISLKTLSLIARQLGYPLCRRLEPVCRNGGELRNAEVSRLLRLAQTGQQRPGSRIAPNQNKRPQIALDTRSQKCSPAQIEQALYEPASSQISVGTLAIARISVGSRKSKPRPQMTAPPCDRHNRQAGPS